MKPEKILLGDWDRLSKEYRRQTRSDQPTCFRIENTHFSISRFSGGFTMDGHVFTIFYPRIRNEIAGETAQLAVRDDFLKWVKRRLADKDNGRTSVDKQEVLF